MTETELQNKIKQALHKLGFWVERTNAGKVSDNIALLSKGTPDLLIVAPCYGWIEVKLPGEDLNENQRRWHHRANRAGVRVETVRSTREATSIAIRWRSEQPLAPRSGR